GVISQAGNELDIIGTGSGSVPDSWDAKVRACIDHLANQRTAVRNFVLAATSLPAGFATVADDAIDRALHLLELFVTDLAGAYEAGETAAHWFKQNHPAMPAVGFMALLDDLQALQDELRQASIGLPDSLRAPVALVIDQAAQDSPDPSGLQAS